MREFLSRRLGRRTFVSTLPVVGAALSCGRTPWTASVSAGGNTGDPINVGPVLQNARPDSMGVMFETTSARGWIDFGETPACDRRVDAQETFSQEGRRIFHTTLDGLKPATSYFYRIGADNYQGRIYKFKTPPARGQRVPFRFAVYSDTQQRPEVHRRIVEHGLLGQAAQRRTHVCDDLAMVLVVGDIVQDGGTYDEYRERFFEPARELSSAVPYYTVIGNHEADSAYYFHYLNLPRNGTPGFEEHWYSFDYGNSHFIGLDTNHAYRTATQLAWLEDDLAAACADPRTDIVFVYFHHPYKSELWPDGEEAYSGEIIRRLEAALVAHGKIGAFFFGHTHGYSRGQSRQASLYWVNVGSAGGTLDRWGDYPNQRPYDEFQRTFDDYGMLTFAVNANGEAGFTAQRHSFGNDAQPLDGVVTDVFTASLAVAAPTQPKFADVHIVDGADGNRTIQLEISLPDSEVASHLETEWQLAPDQDFATVVADRWLRREKIYAGRDVQAGVDIKRAAFAITPALMPPLYARARVRNDRLGWSAWSEPVAVGSAVALGDYWYEVPIAL